MGNLIKINIYAEAKKNKKRSLKVKSLEKNIVKYNKWLRRTNREDKIENYERFLKVK